MRSAAVNTGDSILATQYNNLRADAYGGSMLLARQQSTPDLTLYVESGVVYVGSTRVVFAGGNSPSFTAPSGNPRIDLLTINSSGTLARTAGAENASPVVPTYPTNGDVVLAEVYNKVGQTQVYDTDQGAGKGYIYRDVRPVLGGTYISTASQIADSIITPAKFTQVYVQTSGDETVNGIKTFGSIPILPASDPTTSNQATRKSYVDGVALVLARGTVSDNSNVPTSSGGGTNTDTSVSHGLGKTPKLVVISCTITANGTSNSTIVHGHVGYDSSGNIAFSHWDGWNLSGTLTRSGWVHAFGDNMNAAGVGGFFETITVSVVSVGASTFTFRINGVDNGGSVTSTVVSINWMALG